MSGHCNVCGEPVGPGVFRCTCADRICSDLAEALRSALPDVTWVALQTGNRSKVDRITAALAAYDAAQAQGGGK